LGIDDYEIWFYQPRCINKEKEEQLNAIHLRNLDVLLEYFSEDKIRIIPIDFDDNFRIINPPVFNRLIVRKDNKFTIIFPDQSDEIKSMVNTRISEINEHNPIIRHSYIDSRSLNNLGGNIHCSFKTFPIMPPRPAEPARIEPPPEEKYELDKELINNDKY
jgi:hypothetical protein